MAVASLIDELKRRVAVLENHLENLKGDFHINRISAYTMLANEFRDLELDATEIDIKLFETIAEQLEKQSKDIEGLKNAVNRLAQKKRKTKRKRSR